MAAHMLGETAVFRRSSDNPVCLGAGEGARFTARAGKQQAGTSMMSQANQGNQLALSLLG